MKKSNTKIKKPVVLALYGLAIVLAIYTIFTMYSSYTYIAGLVTQGLVIKDELSSVISYCAGASVPYLFYSVATWAIGYIISQLSFIANEVKVCDTEDLEKEFINVESKEEIAVSEDEE